MGFEVGDDLHGANLRCAGNRPQWRTGAKGVEAGAVVPHQPRHVRFEVHHVGVALHGHQRVDRHAADAAHPAQVVARQVHEHHVLGALLG